MTFPPKFNTGGRLFRPSSDLKVNARLVTGFDSPPTVDTTGFDVSRQTMVLLSVSSTDLLTNSPDGYTVDIIVWRLKREPTVGLLAPAGGWYCRERLTMNLDGNPANGPQEVALPTLNSENMFYQVVSRTCDDPAELPDDFSIHLFTTELSPRTAETGIDCCPAAGAIDAVANETLATHDLPVIAKGSQVMLEAKDFDGAALPNAVAEGDSVRAAATLHGVAYTMLVNKSGSETPIIAQDRAIGPGAGGQVGVMTMDEAKNYDGAALTAVAEGDATRPASTLQGIRFMLPVTHNGAATPVVPDATAISAAAGGMADMMVGAEARAIQAAALATGQSTHLVANLFREIVIAGYEWVTQSIRNQEIDPLDTRDVGDLLTGTAAAAPQTFDFYLDMSHFTQLSLNWTVNTIVGGTNTMTVEVTNQDDGTAANACNYRDVTLRWFGTATFAAVGYLERIGDVLAGAPNPTLPPVAAKYVHIKVVCTDIGNAFRIWARRLYD